MTLSFNGESPTFDPKSNFPSSPSSSSMNNNPPLSLPSTTSASVAPAPPQSAPAFSSHNIGPSSNPSSLPATAPMSSSSTSNIWSNVPSTPNTNQRRPSSYDIWSNNANNANASIWSPNNQPTANDNLGSTRSSFSANLSSPQQPQQQQQQKQQEDTEYSSPPRMFDGSYEMNPNRQPHQVHSQQGSSQSQQQSQQSQPNAHYDFNLRRHSYSDVYSYSNNSQNSNFAGSNTVGNRGGNSSSFNFTEDPITNKSTLQLVNEYFESDPHERVKVTLKLLNERFFDEEKYLSDAYQLPKFPIENNLRNYQLILVGFKAGRIDVFYLPSSPSPELANLRVGDLVIVEADRGRDLGKVFKLNISIDEARLMKLLQFQEQQAALNENENIDGSLSVRNLSEHTSNNNVSPPTLHFPKSILSLAQPNEIIQILNKKQDEEKACRLCLAKIANATGVLTNAANSNNGGNSNQSASAQDLLQMKLIDAEYQFDRKKLIFYYSTSKRIDFRDLVRELFRIYKTRIWMCAVIGLPYTVRKQSSTSPLMNTGSTSMFAHSQQQQQHQQAPQQQAPQQQQAQQVPTATIPQQITLNDPFSNSNNTNNSNNYINVNGGPQPYYNPDRRFSYQPQPVSTGQFPMHPPVGAPSPSMGPSSFNMNNDLIQIPRRFLSEQKNLQPLYHQHPQQQSMPYLPAMMQQQHPAQGFQQQNIYGSNIYPMQGAGVSSSGAPPLSGFMPFRRDSGDLKEVAEEEDVDFSSRLNRGYGNGNSTDSNGGNSNSGESFVLKSLVDSINH
ncbi:putative RNA pol II specific subunit [Scheffersomyces xylosifermentans]|uniref:putative RNA pol II specific subunit n=1 Tax=Scheffersomyces xylosifermentans TaxID=1304137 RepID=UPI00315C53AB